MGHRLVAATPPRDVKRVPRVAKDRKWWKAKEFENGLLYFSIPELKGILDTAGTAHWAGLPYYVEAKHQRPGHGTSRGAPCWVIFSGQKSSWQGAHNSRCAAAVAYSKECAPLGDIVSPFSFSR